MIAAVSIGGVKATAEQTELPRCAPSGTLVRIAELPEGSGVAVSRRTPGRLWSHNDSGDPILFALDANGAVRGRVQLAGAEVEDWEAIAVGPCGAGSCIYVADIGDNEAERDHITLYRLPEPAGASGRAGVEVFRATYPDGPHDAEALLIAPDGRIHVVTKGQTGPVAVYRFPRDVRAGTTVRLERIGNPREWDAPREDRITDGAVSADGQWVVLRSVSALMFYQAADLFAGNWQLAGRVALEPLGEPQGEGVAFGPDNSMYLLGEGGGGSRPGTFGRLVCAPGR